jgi:hypothetical protein
MKLMTIFFFAKIGKNSMAYCYSKPTGDFDSLEQACAVALIRIDAEDAQAHSIMIEPADSEDASFKLYWERGFEGWTPLPKRPREQNQLAKRMVDILAMKCATRKRTMTEAHSAS